MTRRLSEFSKVAVRSVLALLLVTCAPLGWSADSELESRMQEARARLDQAAKELAALYTEAVQVKVKVDKGKDRAMLGILLDDNGDERGLRLAGITPGSGADEAGLKVGDVLTRIDDVSLTGSGVNPLRALSKRTHQLKPGDVAQVDYRRGEQTGSVSVTTQSESLTTVKVMQHKLAELDREMVRISIPAVGLKSPRRPAVAGAMVDVDGMLADYFEVESGVLVLNTPDGAELQPGDIMLTLGEQPIGLAWEAEMLLMEQELQGRDSISGEVLRKGRKLKIPVPTKGWPKAWSQQVERTVKIEQECP